jgi:hypothetical protein
MKLFIIPKNKHTPKVISLKLKDFMVPIIVFIIGIIFILAGLVANLYLPQPPPLISQFLVTLVIVVGAFFLVAGFFIIGQMYGIWAMIEQHISRPITAIILGLGFGIAFWSIPFFIVENYELLPEFMMVMMLGLITFFSTYGSIISIVFFVLGFILGVLLLYSTSSSASY